MPSVVVAPRPIHSPSSAASTHQPTRDEDERAVVVRGRAPTIATTASAVAAPPNSSTAVRRKSRKRISRRRALRARAMKPSDAVHDHVRALHDRRRALVGAHAHPHRRVSTPSAESSSSASNASRSVASSPP